MYTFELLVVVVLWVILSAITGKPSTFPLLFFKSHCIQKVGKKIDPALP